MKSVNAAVNRKVKKNSGLSSIALFLVVFLTTVLTLSTFYSMKYVASSINKKQKENIPEETVSPAQDTFNKKVFEDISIVGKSFVVYDPIKKEIIASKDATTVYPLASITKVMTAILAYQNIEESLQITIRGSDLAPEGDSRLRIGDVWARDDLIAYTLSVSSNDGARVLARVCGARLLGTSTDTNLQVKSFVEKMNSSAVKYSLNSLSFNNESGLDISPDTAGGYGNAQDVAKLFTRAYFEAPDIFETTAESIMYIPSANGNNRVENTNKRASNIPGLAISKTGYTDSALGNLGVVVEIGPGRPIVIVVLHSGKEARFTDVEKLRKATIKGME